MNLSSLVTWTSQEWIYLPWLHELLSLIHDSRSNLSSFLNDFLWPVINQEWLLTLYFLNNSRMTFSLFTSWTIQEVIYQSRVTLSSLTSWRSKEWLSHFSVKKWESKFIFSHFLNNSRVNLLSIKSDFLTLDFLNN